MEGILQKRGKREASLYNIYKLAEIYLEYCKKNGLEATLIEDFYKKIMEKENIKDFTLFLRLDYAPINEMIDLTIKRTGIMGVCNILLTLNSKLPYEYLFLEILK